MQDEQFYLKTLVKLRYSHAFEMILFQKFIQPYWRIPGQAILMFLNNQILIFFSNTVKKFILQI